MPAYSPRLGYDSSGWHLLPLEEGDKMSAADPVYTESFWHTISLQVYLQESPLYEDVIFFSGGTITVVSFFSVLITKGILKKRLKCT